MEKGYFKPDIEDIHVGYECDFWDGNDWRGPLTISEKDLVDLKQYTMRTPYLTKEQIEAEGWKYKGASIDLWFEKEGDFELGSWTARKLRMHYGKDYRMYIHADDFGTEHYLFEGQCRCINDFRLIMRLLKV